jgi:hypothetical protein
MMTVWNFLWLCAAVFALLYLGWRLWADAHPLPLTVEAEQDACREVIQCIGQHHPSEPEEYESLDEPQLMLVHEVNRRAVS